MTETEAIQITGGLSAPSKMPCPSFSISALDCNMGGKLRSIEGSVCNKCYAMRGNYRFPAIQNRLNLRKAGMYHPQWVEAMTLLIKLNCDSHFRWFDSGSEPSVEIFRNIMEVCRNTPRIKHWLPTKEYGFVAEYVKTGGIIPKNLCIRLSGYMVDGPAPTQLAQSLGVQTSTVSKGAFTCPVSTTFNKCGECRKCWNRSVKNVAYKYH